MASLTVLTAVGEAVAVTMCVVMIGVHDFSSVSDAVQFDDTLTIHRDSTHRKQDGMISAAELDGLMHQAWPALVHQRVDGWVARFSDGVTQRANSVLPVATPADLHGALLQVEKLYRDRDLAPAFQLSPAAQPVDLDEILTQRGYELRSPTIVQVAIVEEVIRRLSPSRGRVRLEGEPDEVWMDLWWAVDGRGGSEARAIARRIMTTRPAVYASSHDEAGLAAVGRLALVGRCAGIYCMAVRPNVRRHGHARALLRALLEYAAERGARHTWIQVIAGNEAARGLYERAGFVGVSGYHYRILMSRQRKVADTLGGT